MNRYLVIGIVFAVLILCGLAAAYYYQETIFGRKIECRALKVEITKYLQSAEDGSNSALLDVGMTVEYEFMDVFYSTKLNSCLYTFFLHKNWKPGAEKAAQDMGYKTNDILMSDYVLTDALSQAVVFHAEDLNVFFDKLGEYR